MSAVGGSVESMEISGRGFAVAADSEATITVGGFTNENQANGDGTTRMVKTRVPWMVDGLTVEIDASRGDQEFLQSIADGKVYVVCAFTLASGIVYQGSGQLTGDFGASSQSATAGVQLGGPGKLTQQ